MNPNFKKDIYYYHYLKCFHYYPLSLMCVKSCFFICSYAIEDAAGGGALFGVDENTGLISTAAVLDREDVAWHNITVRAAEVGKCARPSAPDPNLAWEPPGA